MPRNEVAHLAFALPVWVIVKTLVFRGVGLDRGWWRYVSVVDMTRTALGNVAAGVISTALIWSTGPAGFPRSIYVLDAMLCFLDTAGIRVVVRVMAEEVRPNVKGDGQVKRTVIYGACAAGMALLKEARLNPALGYKVVGFVDDNLGKTHLVLNGVKVLGDGSTLHDVITKHRIDMVLIAVPSASGMEMTQILRCCHDAKVSYKTIPSLCDLIEENGLAKQIRNVAVEDLLGRRPARLDDLEIADKSQPMSVNHESNAGVRCSARWHEWHRVSRLSSLSSPPRPR
jgi:FlaA1/EpsC-like NDP-sugar epimerase